MEEQLDNNRVRIFVGGLAETVTAEDLHRLFGSLGSVEGVETIRTKGRSFAYVDFFPSPTDPKSLSKLFSKYNGCLWKGGKLRLEKAKEHYLVCLKREWEEDAAAAAAADAEPEPVSSQQGSSNISTNKGVSMDKESLKTKHLHIFFPKLRKVKSIPFSGTGKHKYSFRNIEVPPLPVHFCDCEEHCSPTVTDKGKLSLDGAAESGGINDEEINIMNSVMNKLFEKDKVSNTKHLEKEQDSFGSPDAFHSNECEVDSATDDDDDGLIINMETKKNKTALMGSQELQRILENQESWSNKTGIAKEEPSNSDVQKAKDNNPKKKKKSLLKLEKKSGGKIKTQTLPDELASGSGAHSAELEDGFGELTKVSWSQKSSWRELLGNGGNTAFNASLILPKVDSGEDQQNSDSPCTSLTENVENDEYESDEYEGSKPTNKEVTKELSEAQATNTHVIEEGAEAQPTNNNVPNKTGRGASWRQKQSWTQLVRESNSSFSISQILPGITFQELMAKEPIVDPVNSSDSEHKGVAKDTVVDGFNLGDIIPEKNQHVGTIDIASVSAVEEKIETRPRERSTEETVPKEKSTEDVEIGETCSFMRNAASLKDWAKAKAALSGSLKRKRGEK